jgi:hypothetical protein
LMDISYGGKDRESFLKELDTLCYWKRKENKKKSL